MKDRIIKAAYEWRAADIHAAACRLDLRDGDPALTEEICQQKLTKLRILLDRWHNLLYT